MRKKKPIKNRFAPLILSIAGCISLPPYVGKETLQANTQEHKALLMRKAERCEFEDLSIIYKTAAAQQPFSTSLGEDNIFYTSRLASGNFYASWTNPANKYNVIVSNGLGSDTSLLESMARGFLVQGINTYSLDRAGSGINLPRKDISTWEDDLLSLAGKVNRPAIMAQCFSTGLVAEVTNTHPELFSKAIYLTPSFYLNYEPSIMEKISIVLSFLTLSEMPHKNPVPIEAYTSSDSLRRVLRCDPLFSYSPTTSTFIKGDRLKNKADRLLHHPRIPSIFVLAEKDIVVDNEKTEKHFAKKTINGPFVCYIDSDHFIPFDNNSIKILAEVIKNED